jgi:cellulose synthase operon protein C
MTRRARSLGAAWRASLALVALVRAASAVPDAAPPHTLPGTSLRSRIAVGAAEARLRADSVDERLRGLERLGSAGTPRAIAHLVRALLPGGAAATPEERLTCVRVLAAHAAEPTVRRALVLVLGGHALPAAAETPSPLDELAQGAAALALARTGGAEALEALGRALDGAGLPARAATTALVAYPPRDLGPVLRGARAPSLALAEALDLLADQRGFERLRALARLGTTEVRARAALALTRLGDYETVALAKRWAAPDQPTTLRIAGTEILATASAGEAPAAVASLLDGPATVTDGLRLARVAPHPSLTPTLSRLLASASDDRAADVIGVLGQIGTADAVRALEAQLTHARHGALAAHALARAPGGDAARALERALARPETARLAARAATVRALLLGDTPGPLPGALERLAASRSPEDRAAAAAGMAALSPARLPALLDSPDDAVVRGAATALLLAAPAVAADAASRLAHAARSTTRTALALALAVPGAEDRAPTATLVALVAEGDAAAPLAARALAARDERRLREDTRSLLESGDPWVRAHAALGLGRSPEPDATGLLESAYRFETDADVRAAIVRALARRPESTRTRTLALAASLDPSDAARSLARLALAGVTPPEPYRGASVVWVPVLGTAGPDGARATVAVRVPGGLVLPAATEGDGLAVIAGLPPGSIELRVAPAPAPDDAP